MLNCFATNEFLDFTGSKLKKIIVKSEVGDFPLEVGSKNCKFLDLNDKNCFVHTPICLSGLTAKQLEDKESLNNFIKTNNLFRSISELVDHYGGFLQTRVDINKEFLPYYFYNDEVLSYIDYRTNYSLEIGKNLVEIIKGMKKDSKYLCKKILKEWDQYSINIMSTSLGHKTSEMPIKKFSDLYRNFALSKKFDKKYIFNESSWTILLNNPLWYLVQITCKRSSANSFSVIGRIGNQLDHTFTITEKCQYSLTRANILKTIDWFSNNEIYEGDLFLGGGIKENDSLAIFKERLGAQTRRFARIRYLYTTKINLEKALNNKILEGYWP